MCSAARRALLRSTAVCREVYQMVSPPPGTNPPAQIRPVLYGELLCCSERAYEPFGMSLPHADVIH
jgi:hypothetical protein